MYLSSVVVFFAVIAKLFICLFVCFCYVNICHPVECSTIS